MVYLHIQPYKTKHLLSYFDLPKTIFLNVSYFSISAHFDYDLKKHTKPNNDYVP